MSARRSTQSRTHGTRISERIVPLVLAFWFQVAFGSVPCKAGVPAAPSPDTTTVVLHLDDTLSMAHARNWDLQSAAHDLAIARAAIRTAGERPNPTVSWVTSGIHTDGQGDATELGNDFWSRSYDNVAQFQQLFESAGKRSKRRHVAAAGADAAQARLEDERRVIDETVVQAYVGAALAEAGARIANESAGYLRDESRIAEIRLRAGDISRSDLDQIQIEADRLDLDARAASRDALAQRIALEVLLGRPTPRGAIVVADSLEQLADRAIGTGARAAPPGGVRPDVAAARADLRGAEASLALAFAQRIPDPALLFQFEHEPPARPNSIGLGVSFPLPLWSRNAGAISAAKSARENARNEVSRTEAEFAADTAGVAAELGEASGRWQRYRDELRPRSDEIRRTISLAYQRGGASLVDLLQAQRSDNDVRLATMQAAADAAIAAARLRSFTTMMIPEVKHP
jgi:cobalt-zinc-cadmium efflux system outer membrane protein